KYTVARKVRKKDAYSPGGVSGLRPDRASIVYTSRIKQAYKGIPVILGGIEASLRRLAHYDYWSDKIRKSILIDSKADMLIYGMGETTIRKLALRLKNSDPVSEITDIPGTVFRQKHSEIEIPGRIELPSFEKISADKKLYSESFKIQFENTDSIIAFPLVENYGDWDLIQNSPEKPMTTKELDSSYDLPYERREHPSYKSIGGIPALREVQFSLASSRGCFGGCNYCALTFLQGRTIQARSHESIEKEAAIIIKDKNFKGYIHDVGGPTANFRKPSCTKQITAGVCKTKQCLFPAPCSLLEVDHSDYITLLRKLRNIKGVKKVFIRSGIRYDYILEDSDQTFMSELIEHHISGQLKIAPEHVSKEVLDAMGRPTIDGFIEFTKKYKKMNKEMGLKQYLIPYLISSHPGSRLKHAIELAEFLRDYGFIPDQVQDFYPTPGTLSTAMFHTGYHPITGRKIYVPKDNQEKIMQRALIHYNRPENYRLVKKALIQEGRNDLIGTGRKCLIKPYEPGKTSMKNKKY
ncbi:MAG: YgiQ family radical SAM protein, partial [Spirochaetales bacterium]|nr:YgiQ family radical SAM protein [Spirochaetales bacterium]